MYLDWSKGFSTMYYGYIVDKNSWYDERRFEITTGTVNISDDDLIQSATLTTSEHLSDSEKWIRIYIDAKQDGGSYHGALFTGLISSPSITIEGVQIGNEIECHSVLKPASDILLPRGWYVAQGSNGPEAVKKLLSVSPAPITLDSTGPNLASTLVAEDGETNLSMARKILDAIKWEVFIAGDGRMTLRSSKKYSRNDIPVVSFDSMDYDCLEPSVRIAYDWFNVPNVFRAIDGTATAIARNEEDIEFRGREIWREESNCTLNDDETLDMYAKRRLIEERNIEYEVSYTRRYEPSVQLNDKIMLNYPAQNLVGYFRVKSQSISLGHNGTVSEVVYKV